MGKECISVGAKLSNGTIPNFISYTGEQSTRELGDQDSYTVYADHIRDSLETGCKDDSKSAEDLANIHFNLVRNVVDHYDTENYAAYYYAPRRIRYCEENLIDQCKNDPTKCPKQNGGLWKLTGISESESNCITDNDNNPDKLCNVINSGIGDDGICDIVNNHLELPGKSLTSSGDTLLTPFENIVNDAELSNITEGFTLDNTGIDNLENISEIIDEHVNENDDLKHYNLGMELKNKNRKKIDNVQTLYLVSSLILNLIVLGLSLYIIFNCYNNIEVDYTIIIIFMITFNIVMVFFYKFDNLFDFQYNFISSKDIVLMIHVILLVLFVILSNKDLSFGKKPNVTTINNPITLRSIPSQSTQSAGNKRKFK